MKVRFGKSYKQIPLKDLTILAIIPVVLVTLFLLPANIRDEFILFHDSPTLIGIYFTHFVHETLSHFSNNFIFYLLILFFLYYFALGGETKKQFYFTFAIFLLVLPFFISAFELALVSFSNLNFNKTVGFSGINSAFLGVLPYFAIMSLKRMFWPKINITESVNLFVFLAAGFELVIYSRYLASSSLYILVILILVIWGGFFVYILRLLRHLKTMGVFRRRQKSDRNALILLVSVFALYAIFLTAVFPASLINGKTFVDVFAHAFGLAFGFFISILLSLLTERKKKKFRKSVIRGNQS